MEAIVPYLNFNSIAAEVLAFYSKVLNAVVLFQQTFRESSFECLQINLGFTGFSITILKKMKLNNK